LFGSNHVADIVGTSASTSTIAAAATWLMTRNEMLVALKDTCKYLEERKLMLVIMCMLVWQKRVLMRKRRKLVMM
jgi:hypothetical protein